MKIDFQWFIDKKIISATEQEKDKLRLFHFEVNITEHEKKAQMNPVHTHATAKEVDGIHLVHIEGNKLGHSMQISSSTGFKEFHKKDMKTAAMVETCLKYMLEHAKEMLI